MSKLCVIAIKKRISFSAKYPGSTHDSFIWSNSDLRRRFLAGEFGDSYLLGDSGYSLEPYIMTPIHEPQTQAERSYNRSHIQTRLVVEQTFGVLKSRFRCLHTSGGSLQYAPDKCAKIVIACLLPHNYCLDQRLPLHDDMLVN
ncbi:putative nuclease HARBI1 [Penaeus monodon]|uniref:putative nuclease HARBI1 n=1 Tax=Penaeus monodon TaxID=6687 RepID=UPI0018A79074|nr:putative nuclease HARBI1 [Penaeus monodon]